MKILKINKKKFKQIIKIAIKFIKEEKVLVCPTDTVYGLICDATNKKAIQKVFKIKKREPGKPIPIFVRDIVRAKKLARIDKKQEEFLRKVWPGRITVILKRKKSKIKIYGVDKETIGLRIPKHKLLNILLKKLNRPLTGTSANISGKSASTKIKEVINQFENQKHRPDLVLDAGNLKPAKPSTVIDLTTKNPKILRKGEISTYRVNSAIAKLTRYDWQNISEKVYGIYQKLI